MTSDLTPKQEKFAQRLIETDKPSDSYRYAYDAENMSDEAIAVEACRLQDNPNVALRIEELRKLHLRRHEVTVDRIVSELSKLAFLDIRKAFDDKGNLIPIHELDSDTAAAIAGLEVDKKVSKITNENGDPMVESFLHKIKLSDKKGALDSLARYLGMFTDKAEISGPNGGPIETKHTGSVTITADLQKATLDELTQLFTEKMKG